MLRALISGLIALGFAMPASQAIAQEDRPPANKTKNRTLRYAEPERTSAVGVEVIAPTPRGGPLKVWELGQEGPSLGKDDNLVVGIDSIALYPGIMRVTYFFHQKGERTHGINVVGTKLYVADGGGETYRPTDWQFKPNGEGQFKVTVQGGTKERFWVEFPAPKNPTSALKFGIPVYDFLWSGIAFKPFSVTLNKPLFFDNGVFQLEGERNEGQAREEDVDGGGIRFPGPPPSPTRLRSARRALTPRPTPSGVNMAPIDPEELAATFLSLSGKGVTVNGSIQPKSGGTTPGRIVFMRRSRDDLVEARIVSTGKGVAINLEIVGAFLEDLSTPSGLTLKMFDFAKTRYFFTLTGNNLSGEDSLGNKFNFVISTK